MAAPRFAHFTPGFVQFALTGFCARRVNATVRLPPNRQDVRFENGPIAKAGPAGQGRHSPALWHHDIRDNAKMI